MKIWVIDAGNNPTTDFYIKPWLSSEDSVIEYHRLSDSIPSSETLPDRVVFVRYFNLKWLNWIKKNRDELSQVSYFIDDDLLDLSSQKHLPLVYRTKLFFKSYLYKKWLKDFGVELVVSTEYLAEKYQSWSPLLIHPENPHVNVRKKRVFFYHGSYSHVQEMIWLKSVVKSVLDQDTSLQFEIIGDKKVRRLFSGIDRVQVIHPVNWASYQNLISTGNRLIGLAPLLDDPFNKARSYTKFFDITAAGAVGLYADSPVYQSIVKNGYNGFLLEMHHDAWVEAILRLSQDSQMRDALLKNARGKA